MLHLTMLRQVEWAATQPRIKPSCWLLKTAIRRQSTLLPSLVAANRLQCSTCTNMFVTQHASESLLRCMIRFLALFDLYGPHAVSDPLRSSNNHPSQTVQSPALLPQNSPGMRAVLLIRTIIMSSPRSTDGSVDQWDKCSTQSGHLARRVRRSKYAYHSAHRNNDPRGAQFYSRKS